MFSLTRPGHLLGGHTQVGAFLEENPEIGEASPGKGFHLEIGIGSQGADPVDQLPGCRFLLDPPELPETVKGFDAAIGQVLTEVWKVDAQDQPHHVRVRKGDMMEIAAAEEGIGEVLLRVGGDDDHRPVPGRDGLVDLDDVKLHLVQNIEHVVLEVRVRLVDFIDQQDGSHLCRQRPDRSCPSGCIPRYGSHRDSNRRNGCR